MKSTNDFHHACDPLLGHVGLECGQGVSGLWSGEVLSEVPLITTICSLYAISGAEDMEDSAVDPLLPE